MRRFTMLLESVALAIVTASIAAAATPTQDAQSAALLAKHRAYVGWEFGDGTFRSMRVTGNVKNEKGETTQTFVSLSVGAIYHDTYTYPQRGDTTEHEGFTGRLFWNSDLNGFTTPVYGDYAKFLASYTMLQQEGTTRLPATFVKTKTIDGKTASVVRVTLENGDPIEIAIDPDTGAYVEATIDPDGAYETTFHVLSYGDPMPGKKMIASYRVGQSKSIHTFSKFEPNVPISDDELHPPAPTAQWTFTNQDPVPLTLTFYRILVDATVNGVKGRFILDTGADAIVLNDNFADRAGAKALKGGTQAITMEGAVSARVRRVDSLSVGGATLRNALVYSQDFSRNDWRGLDDAGYDGLMGFDLFAAAVVKLDVYASKMTILDPATADLSNAAGIPLVVDVSDGIPTIPMTLNKTLPVNAMLDTGNPGIVFFGSELMRKHHLRTGRGGVQSLTIGPIVYENETAYEGGIFSDDVLLGFDFLKHFDFIFDYPHGRMYMTPNKN